MAEWKTGPAADNDYKYDLDQPYPVGEGQVNAFRRDGHICLPQLVSESGIEYYRQEILSAVKKLNTEKRPLKDRDTYGKAFLQIFNLWRTNKTMERFVLAKRFGDVAARLMGVDRVRIYHDQALFKEAGGGHTPWHQDQFYWPLDTDNTVTLWMPLIDLNEDMGILQFASGSHKKGYILAREISDASEDFFMDYIRTSGFTVTSNFRIKAGDATFHSGWTLHHAPANRSDRMREVMTIIYYADKTKILRPDSPYRENDLKAWLGGKTPGEEASSEMNPLI